MASWFSSLSTTDQFFLLCAFVGSFGVLLRLISQFFGLAHDGVDGLDADIDMGDGDAHHAGDGFRIISIHGLAAFFMMFGLVGFAANRENAPVAVSVVSGVVAGAVSVWIITKLFTMASKLQSVGNLDINKAAGCAGVVYMQIPKGSSGRVAVNIGGRQREMDAVHVNGGAIPTGAKIVVVRIDGSIAVVDTVTDKEE